MKAVAPIWPTLAVLVIALVSVASPLVNVTVVVMEDYEDDGLRFGWNKSMPAVNMAEEAVMEIYRDKINFTFVYHKTGCYSDAGGALFAHLYCESGVSVLIGPGCSTPLFAIAPLAMAWNVPLVNPIAAGLYDKDKYPLVTTLSPYSPSSYGAAIAAFLRYYSYTNIAILEDSLTNYVTPAALRQALIVELDKMPDVSRRVYQVNVDTMDSEDFEEILDQASASARVLILFTTERSTREIMLQAYTEGRATSGEYVFIINIKLAWDPELDPGWDARNYTEEENRQYLESLGHAYFLFMEVWEEIHVGDNFTDELMKRTLEDYGYDYGDTLPSQWVPGYYDSVIVYAEVLNETLAAGGSATDGRAITASLVNRTFPGVLKEVKLNEDGIRLNDVTFGYFDVSNGEFHRAVRWCYVNDALAVINPPGFVWQYSDNIAPPNTPECGYMGITCTPDTSSGNIILVSAIVGVLGLFLVIGALIAAWFYRKWRKRVRTDLWWWKIDPSELVTVTPDMNSMFGSRIKITFSPRMAKKLMGSMRTFGSENNGDTTSLTPSELIREGSTALWKGQRVSVTRLQITQNLSSQPLLKDFSLIRELNHTNINKILGACLDPDAISLVTERCSKGTLQDLLGNPRVTLDEQFKCSLSTDIINGLCYLHESPVRFHGRLSSQTCLIDNRFTVKLSDYGLSSLYAAMDVDKGSQEFKNECLWKAPEILRSETQTNGSREADMYSLAIVMDEVCTREAPFFSEADILTLDEILEKIKIGMKPPFRPATKMALRSHGLQDLIEACWAEDPKHRLTVQAVRAAHRRLASAQGTSSNLLDNLMRRMELYANNLENMVEEKTVELREEKKKSDELLYQILPKSVANKLRCGLKVEPQTYESVTIFFSDIVGFTSLSAESSPMEIVAFLNDLYTCFDAIIEEYDVYKVETIGDAYMVVSGLPQENGNLHAVHIANMSLKLLRGIKKFHIRHRPGTQIMLRIGCHSGSVVAGVVGLKMPRYCLFGDTVNTASRMESNGEALKIHLSESMKDILETFGYFRIESRGVIPIKGKGEMETFWLLGRKDSPCRDSIRLSD